MPRYHVHTAAVRDTPIPPVAELTTIEAESPEAALELLKREAFAITGRVATVWLKVVVSYWPTGEARHILSCEVPVTPIAGLN